MLNPQLKEILAAAIVQSLLIIASAAAISYLVNGNAEGTAETIKAGNTPATCPGTKLNYPRVIEENIRGQVVSFRYNCIQEGYLASSYDGNCEGCSGRTHFTNEPVRWGICAVDPNVIPPHSVFYVPGYGPCKAADKGGAVKGKRIDLGFEDIRKGWWSRRYTDIFTFVE